MRDNDSLRREISRVTGIRKFTDDVPQNNICRVLLDAQTKFSEFREKITNIASSLIKALDCNSEQGPDLVLTTNSRSVSLDKDVSNSTVKTYRKAVLSRSPRNTHATTTNVLLVNVRMPPVSAHPRQTLFQIPLPQPHPRLVRNQESFIFSKQHRHNIDNNIGIST